MKKRVLLLITIALVGITTFTFSTLRAQNDAAPTPPASATQPAPPRPAFHRNVQYALCRQAIISLMRFKQEMEHSQEDYDGHRQPAIDACDKAIKELEAVRASMQAKRDATKPAAPTP